MGSGVSFVVVLHQVWKKHPLHQDFLGLYTLKSDKLSEQTHGLLGMTLFMFPCWSFLVRLCTCAEKNHTQKFQRPIHALFDF